MRGWSFVRWGLFLARFHGQKVFENKRLAGDVKPPADPSPEESPLQRPKPEPVGANVFSFSVRQLVVVLFDAKKAIELVFFARQDGEVTIKPSQELIDDFGVLHWHREVNRCIEGGDKHPRQHFAAP